MKKFKILFLFSSLFILLFTNLNAIAQNTFTIKPHNRTHMLTREEYPMKADFNLKDKNITNVQLDLHLQCPETGCSDWDYSINVVLRTHQNGHKRDYQLGRMITPYSGDYNRGKNASKWDHIWSWNVTEYLPLLRQDSIEIVMQYEGYQDGFLATTDFIFTEDNNAMKDTKKFIGVEQVYYDYYPFGRPDTTIDEYLGEKTIVLPKGTKQVLSRLQISGHGEDTLNAAAEFLKKSFVYVANNQVVDNSAVWRDDCGCNPIQPQGGTWIYNRSGWCPGTKVLEYYYDLTPFVENGKLNIKMLFEYYNNQGLGLPGYQIANELFFIADKHYKHKNIDDVFGAGKDNNIAMQETHYLPKKFNLVFKTNNMGDDKYAIFEQDKNRKDYNKPLYERQQMSPQSEYKQEVNLSEGNYMIEVTDNGGDGMSWWANPDQGDGYVLIYNEDMTEVLEAFDPDFGSKMRYYFTTTEDNSKIKHSQEKLVVLQDRDAQIFRVIMFNVGKVANPMNVKIVNRKTKDVVYDATYNAKGSFDQTIYYDRYEDGYYQVSVKCGNLEQHKTFIKRTEK